jgi:hypothetical protein
MSTRIQDIIAATVVVVMALHRILLLIHRALALDVMPTELIVAIARMILTLTPLQTVLPTTLVTRLLYKSEEVIGLVGYEYRCGISTAALQILATRAMYWLKKASTRLAPRCLFQVQLP